MGPGVRLFDKKKLLKLYRCRGKIQLGHSGGSLCSVYYCGNGRVRSLDLRALGGPIQVLVSL